MGVGIGVVVGISVPSLPDGLVWSVLVGVGRVAVSLAVDTGMLVGDSVAPMLTVSVAVAVAIMLVVAVFTGVKDGLGVAVAVGEGIGVDVAGVVLATPVCTPALSSGLLAVQSRGETVNPSQCTGMLISSSSRGK